MHFGDEVSLNRSDYASRLKFNPHHCNLLTLDEMVPYLGLEMKQRIVFIGHSFTRQVVQGIVCTAHAMGLLTHYHLDWFKCSENHHYPCHGTVNCITCGEHSGYHDESTIICYSLIYSLIHSYNLLGSIKFLLKGGALIEVFELRLTVEDFFVKDPGNVDLIVVQRFSLYYFIIALSLIHSFMHLI